MTDKEPVFKKCSPENMCTWLADRVERIGFTGKGLIPVYRLNSHGKLTSVLYGVKYRQGRGDDGVMINHCPFCGQTPGKFAQEMKR